MIEVILAATPWVSLFGAACAVTSSIRTYRRFRRFVINREHERLLGEIARMKRFKQYVPVIERGGVLPPALAIDYIECVLMIHRDNPAEACHSLAVTVPVLLAPHRRSPTCPDCVQ